MTNLDEAFKLAKRHFPHVIRYGESQWSLEDGEQLSGMVEHRGKLVLHEKRKGSKYPFNHWGFYATVTDPDLGVDND